MKIIDRYVGTEVLVTSLFAVAVLSLVLILGNVFQQVLNHDVPFESLLTFIGYILPYSLTFTIPWGFLTAVLLVFGKMSAENELIALRSNGIGISRICLPLLVIAIVFTGLCLWINVEVAPRAKEKMKGALYHIATSNPLSLFDADQVIDKFTGKKIYVERKEGASLYNILVYEMNDSGDLLRVIHAREGELEIDLAQKQVLMHLKKIRYEEHDQQAPDDFGKIRQGITMSEFTFAISLQSLYDKNKKRRGLSQMTLRELMSRTDPSQITASRTEVNQRFSFSLASIAFALVGVPLAITAHRKETSVGFLFSIILGLVYYFFIIIADNARNNPKLHPEILIWAPNIIFISLGAWLFYRMAKR